MGSIYLIFETACQKRFRYDLPKENLKIEHRVRKKFEKTVSKHIERGHYFARPTLVRDSLTLAFERRGN